MLIRRSIVAFGILIITSFIVPQEGHAQTIRTVNPSESIQTIINAATSGDTILLEDGIYYQRFTINKPLTVKAINPGNVVISGAYDGSLGSLTFQAETGTPGLYSASIPWTPPDSSREWWVRHGERNLMNYETLARLVAFEYPNQGGTLTPGPPEGFAFEGGRLYIRLLGNLNPNNETITVSWNGNTNTGGVRIDASDVTVEGLTITGWYEFGLWMQGDKQRVYIRNNYFNGSYRQLYIKNGTHEQNYDVYIENNEFSKYPTFEYRKNATQDLWSSMYESNLGAPAIRTHLNGVHIKNNYMYETFDGILMMGWENDNTPTTMRSEVSHNVIRNFVDNSLEFDTNNTYTDIWAHHNFLMDGHAYLSMSSHFYGKALVDHNIFYNSPSHGLNGVAYWLKTPTNCLPNCTPPPIVNLTVAHNTVYLGDTGIQESRVYISDSVDSTYQDSLIQNNIVWVDKVSSNDQWQLTQTTPESTTNGFEFKSENLIWGSNFWASRFPTPRPLRANPLFVSDIVSSATMDFNLQSISPSRNRGETNVLYNHTASDGLPDAGAIEYGDTWNMPQPGPSWATDTNMPVRPSIPTSLDSSWLGFDSCARKSHGDTDCNDSINIADLSALLANFGSMIPNHPADANGDGMVNLADLSALLANFGS
ncbi:right-handed parallel beta-helix repeat-containing protein [Candidatus Roizmanbacteria bacterium]|nr:right-handed parallel beta-helix repeat-containing protein [Candidatus Roizmanbacteria bacterium]